ncbi:MAG: hypothetical protein ABSE96_12380 [Terracidiphilus sp.]|jgi:hypothetical protein
MSFYLLVLGTLGVWRITHLLNQEAGPAEVLTRLRRWLGSGLFGRLLDCFYCLSLWIALPFAALVGHTWLELFLLWPALSGAAILLEKMSARTQLLAAEYYEEEAEEKHVLR